MRLGLGPLSSKFVMLLPVPSAVFSAVQDTDTALALAVAGPCGGKSSVCDKRQKTRILDLTLPLSLLICTWASSTFYELSVV